MKPQLEIKNIHPVNFLCIDWDKHLENRKAITYEFALAKVCEKYQVTPQQIKGKDRHAYIMDARHAYRFILKYIFDLDLMQVARQLGKFEHSNVIHSLQTTKNLCQTEKRKYNELYDLCYSIDKSSSKKFHEIIFKKD